MCKKCIFYYLNLVIKYIVRIKSYKVNSDVKMSARSSKIVSIEPEDPINWLSSQEDGIESDEEVGSITSEEDGECGSDGFQRVRAKTVQEIWEDEIIWSSLQQLPGCNELLDYINNDLQEKIIDHPNSKQTGMLLASWLNKDKILRSLLENGTSPNVGDNQGRTPLHLACSIGSETCTKLLLEHGASVSRWDSQRKATPLHCAAGRGHLPCLKLLIKHNADVNVGITGKSPLHYAVQSEAVDCVKALLEAGAIPNTPQVFSESPLHVAAALGKAQIIKLLLDYGAEVRVQCGSDKSTALHLAAEDGNAESTKLLLDAGAKIMAQNYKLQTPLHLAALSQCAETLELLLKRGADPNVKDKDGRTPLHCAIVKVSRSCECVCLLINAGANVNTPDNFGYTPLHLAALNEFSHCVLLLLNHGGDVTARTNGGISVLTFITRRTPDVIPKYVEKLDSSIKVNDHEIGDVDCELKLDFRILVPSMNKGETELLLNFIEVGHREILKHPLCETFLFLKWRRIRKFFLFSLFYHSLFVFLFTLYINGVFLRDCPSSRQIVKQKDTCLITPTITRIGYLIIILNIMLMCKELFQIAHNWLSYIKQKENWLQWLIIINVFCCVYPTENMNIKSNFHSWQHHVAAIGIFLTWVELMMIIGRFPIFGLYVQMFTTVAVNFSKFLFAYLCLLIAFALSFSVLFPHYPAFKSIFLSILKIIMMMIGELEFEDIFYGEQADRSYPVTSHVMFLTFVLLVTVILMNLMVGLAVSDIQGLQRSAGLDRLVRQAELVAHLESILFSKLLRCISKKCTAMFHRHALLLKSEYHWALYIRPNDPREERIPKDLIKNIYKLVADRKPKKKRSQKCTAHKSYNFVTSKVRSAPVSRVNSKNDTFSMDGQNQIKMKLYELNQNLMEEN